MLDVCLPETLFELALCRHHISKGWILEHVWTMGGSFFLVHVLVFILMVSICLGHFYFRVIELVFRLGQCYFSGS